MCQHLPPDFTELLRPPRGPAADRRGGFRGGAVVQQRTPQTQQRATSHDQDYVHRAVTAVPRGVETH
eukprot:gene2202-biopygen22979